MSSDDSDFDDFDDGDVFSGGDDFSDAEMEAGDDAFDPIPMATGGGANSNMPKKSYQTAHTALSASALTSKQQTDIQHVIDLLGPRVQRDEAIMLLLEGRWNKERLLEQYMEDADAVLRKALGHSIAKAGLTLEQAPLGFICEICYCEQDGSDDMAELKRVQMLQCGHAFCADCYSHYLTAKIREEGEIRALLCPATRCPIRIPPSYIHRLVDADTAAKYDELLRRAYVEDGRSYRWCNYPDCTSVVECHVLQSQLNHIVPSVTCANGHRFCFGCGNTEHQPCPCPLSRLWLKKCADDSETSNWISANTKECTKCHSTIEKNGGCNHMTCKQCKWEFCWVCLGPWQDHGTSWYNCNRFEEKDSKSARDAQSKSRAALERYLHYFNRYANHQQSAKLANEFYTRTEKKMEEMQHHSSFSWIEVQFMRKALDVVLDCRRVLMWTYAFAFYLEKSNQTELFEDNQRDLEMAVESLNELIEQPIPDTDLDDEDTSNNNSSSKQKEREERERKMAEMKQQILDKTEYCARRLDVVLEDTAKGLLEERWKYMEKI